MITTTGCQQISSLFSAAMGYFHGETQRSICAVCPATFAAWRFPFQLEMSSFSLAA
jgi:hypothetical protein